MIQPVVLLPTGVIVGECGCLDWSATLSNQILEVLPWAGKRNPRRDDEGFCSGQIVQFVHS